MKTSCILMSMSWALFASANPFGGPLDGANMRGLAKRTVKAPLSCSPPLQDFFVSGKNVNNKIQTQVIGLNFKVIMPIIPGKAYSTLRLNIGTTRPTASSSANPAAWNSNSYCRPVNSGNYAICIVPLSTIGGNQCGATDYFMSLDATFTNGAVGTSAGPCVSLSCASDWRMYSILRFDCSGTGGGATTSATTSTITRSTTSVSTRVSTVTASATRTVVTTLTTTRTPVRTTVTTTAGGVVRTITSTLGAILVPVVSTRTVTGAATTRTVAVPVTITVQTTVAATTTLTIGAPVGSVSACAVQTAVANSGTGINLLRTLTGVVTNLLNITPANLLTGVYGNLNVRNSAGVLVRVGQVFIKLNPDRTLFVAATSDPGYRLGQLGVTADCLLPGAISTLIGAVGGTVAGLVTGVTGALGGLLGSLGLRDVENVQTLEVRALTSCVSWELCQILSGLSTVTTSGTFSVANILGNANTCLAGTGTLGLGIVATVQKLVLPGQSC